MGEILRFPRGGPAAPSAPPEREGDSELAQRTDEELMALVRGGVRPAFRTLVLRHSEKMASFCARVTGDRASAREVAQEVWLALWDGRLRWEPRSRFSSYLYSIAFTRSRNHVRARRRSSAFFAPEPLQPEITEGATKPEVDRLLEAERRERVWAALGALPEAMREALLLRVVEELSYDEMESILRTNVSTLRSRVHHGLERLKRRLTEEDR
jgi:RNA polymerase sigma-70 factor, ECF subfamily